MTEPNFTERLLEKMAPWNKGPITNGKTDFERYVAALAAPYEEVEEIAMEEGVAGEPGYVPAYGKLLDPTLCPAKFLPWLGMFVGVEIPAGATEAEARAIVKAESGLARGTKASLEALLRKALGVAPFTILERTKTVEGDDAYWVTIIVPTGHISQPVYEQINLTIPGGILYQVIERSGTWFTVTPGRKWSEVKAGLTWAEAKEGEP